jgi:hypothetical protein
VNRDVYFALIIIGLLPVIGALMRGGAIGSGVTLCILMVAVGAVGLVVEARRLVPHARAVKRR